MGSNLSQTFPPKPLFSVEQIPDLTGQVIIWKRRIGKGNMQVYLAARSKSRADDAIEWLKSETNGKTPVFLELDLGNLASVRKAAEEFKSKEQELHVLFNNAGVMAPPVEQRTFDDYDLQTHHSQAHGHARVINTSSASVYLAPRRDCLGNLGNRRIEHNSVQEAGHSYPICLRGNVLFSNELAKRYAHQGVISSSLNPGNLQQNFCAICHGWLRRFLCASSLVSSYGALTQLWSGTMPRARHNGKFLIPWARIGDAGVNSHNEQLAENLWNWLEEQVKGH
ncbi:NAD-P-binding protein [Rhizoctonia solani]|uniref:NAD-P-binding protein n=1 Tax=Rhizoctonia solani TaxID=456999 RepID=A0A8H7IGL2_9AGAM|nr:NAD-P-binding protein [Rhizoctonia solani]